MSRGRAEENYRDNLLLCDDHLLLIPSVDLIQIYQCLCDRTRLRILHLLTQSPLCVCHFQEILDEPQVKISKHLAYLRSRGLVETTQEKNWVIYSLPEKRDRKLDANLKCLQDCMQTDRAFRRDLRGLTKLRAKREEPSVAVACC